MKNLLVNQARDPNKDQKYKKISEMRASKQCVLDGCIRPLTHFQGPGSLSLCREHQLYLRDYGGPGRLDRPYTFWKKDYCESCGRRPSLDNPKIVKLKEPIRTSVGRMMLHVDHQTIRKQGTDHPDNLVTLCVECHQLKTYSNADHIS